MSCALYDLQDQIRTYLLARDYFEEMNVLSERPKSIDDRVAKLAAKYSGLFITILTVSGKKNDNQDAPVCADIFVDLHVTEKVNVNRAQEDYRTAPEVIEHLMRTLHRTFQPAVAEEALSFVAFDPEPVPQGDLLVLGLRMKTRIQFSAEPANQP